MTLNVKLRRYKDLPYLYDDDRIDSQYIQRQRTYKDGNTDIVITPLTPLFLARTKQTNGNLVPTVNKIKPRKVELCFKNEFNKQGFSLLNVDIPYRGNDPNLVNNIREYKQFSFIDSIRYLGQDERK